jgi:hypothetical protein
LASRNKRCCSGINARPYSYTTFADNGIMLEQTELLALVAVVLALALVGLVAVQAMMVPQQAEAAGCENGQAASLAVNASKGRCFGH